MTKGEPRSVNAAPEKHLFVRTLTRDIELTPAIADLVDNSVDGALRELQARGIDDTTMDALEPDATPFEDFEVRIEVSKNRFSIVDNCSGIELDIAVNYAFRFGRPEGWESVKHGVGQFGVGMKRSLFKMGRHFTVESRAAESSFTLEVTLEDWLDDEDWLFPLTESDQDDENPPDQRGTVIEIDDLYPDVANRFDDPVFVQELRSFLEIQHQRSLNKGLNIYVNGTGLRPYEPTLLSSAEIQPIVRRVAVDVDGSEVTISVRAGISRELDVPEAEDRTQAERAGWYVYCNERLIVAANKSDHTGWGVSTANYHPQYRAFRGFCYIDADDPAALPWNTTKTGFNTSDPVYMRAKQEMAKALKEVQAVLNALKKERERVTSEDDRVLERALRQATPTPPSKLTETSSLKYPQPARPPKSAVSVQYSVDREKMQEVIDALGADSAREAGMKTFDYFYEAEIELS